MFIPPIDMFGLPPVRSESQFSSYATSRDLPAWVSEEHYENCNNCASLLYKVFKK